jgi:hypothetical protein
MWDPCTLPNDVEPQSLRGEQDALFSTRANSYQLEHVQSLEQVAGGAEALWTRLASQIKEVVIDEERSLEVESSVVDQFTVEPDLGRISMSSSGWERDPYDSV